jgi:flagellar capping protein FliD
MTQAQRQAIGSTLDQVAKVVALIGGCLVIIAAVWGVTAWLTGGLRPQIQVASDALSDKVTSIQGDISDIKKRLNDLPTSYEVGAQRTHFDRLDDRVGAVEKQESNLEGRVSALEHPQWRQPH